MPATDRPATAIARLETRPGRPAPSPWGPLRRLLRWRTARPPVPPACRPARIVRQSPWVVAGISVANALAPGAAVAAPFGNTVLGPTPAPVTLEYFTSLRCPACEQFEREVLPRLLDPSSGGTLRVVVRQLPSTEPADASQARALLCLRSGPDYLARRAALKRRPQSDAAVASECRSDTAAQSVLDFNAAVFRAEGFPGTPAFVLTRRDGATAIARRSWAGRTTLRDWQAELSQLSTPSATEAIR